MCGIAGAIGTIDGAIIEAVRRAPPGNVAQAGAPGLFWSRIWAVYDLGWWCRRHRVNVR